MLLPTLKYCFDYSFESKPARDELSLSESSSVLKAAAFEFSSEKVVRDSRRAEGIETGITEKSLFSPLHIDE